MAVVKADGYGHGAETVATAALRSGASSLGVATLQEGLELRDAGHRGAGADPQRIAPTRRISAIACNGG